MRVIVTKTSDFICPWCYIGKRKLEAAVALLPPELAIEVRYRPFELNPGMPAEGIERRRYRIAKFGSWERSLMLDAQVIEAARAEGLVFDYERQPRTPNTVLAHRLMWLAEADGADQGGLAGRLFAAYFTEGRNLSDKAVLREIAAATGLAADRVAAVLDGPLGEAETDARLDEARRKGIQGVPHFEIGDLHVSGAQPAPVLAAALRQAAGLRSAA